MHNTFINESINLDASGKFSRPKKCLQTTKNIFTFLEFDKYKNQHKLQRFRSIIPYWVQNVRSTITAPHAEGYESNVSGIWEITTPTIGSWMNSTYNIANKINMTKPVTETL